MRLTQRLLALLFGDALTRLGRDCYARGYADGQADARAELLEEFRVLEHDTRPTLH
jgi:hypothetical protein